MAKRTLIINSPHNIEQEICIKGWVERIRIHGKLAFLDVRDRSASLQVVVVQGVAPKAFETILNLRPEFVVQIEGVVHKRGERYINSDIPTGEVELEAKHIAVISEAHILPFDMGGKDLNLQLPTLLDYRSLTLRHQKVRSIFQVQAKILEGFRKMAQQYDCTEIVVPTLSPSSTEGGAEVFKVDYYGHDAFLTQSPQLYKQMMVPVFERVYTIAHAYRAEPSVTTRHLSEVTQMDCEIGFVDFAELLDILEGVAVGMLKFAEEECADVFKQFDTNPIAFGTIPRLTLAEAQEIIFKETGRDNRGEKDLDPQDEIDICAWALKNHGSDLVTITHFPTKKRAFYTMPDEQNTKLSLSFDILFRGVEISSGSQRIHNYDELIRAIEDRGMDPSKFAMYLQAFRYGMPPEGGFSFGLERITMHILGLSNVREASLFPRDMERIDERFSKTQEEEAV